MEQKELTGRLNVGHKKHRFLGLRDGRGQSMTGGYLVDYERFGILVVATVGPYRAVGFSIAGSRKRLLKKYERHPELRQEAHPHQNGLTENEEI